LTLQRFGSNHHHKPLLARNAVDARGIGKWGDKRDRKLTFPAIGTFTFSLATQIPYTEALQESLIWIAARIKKDVDRVKNDVGYRVEEFSCSDPVPAGY
jgi:hypothetical protein